MAVSRRNQFLWRFLAGLFAAGALASLATWAVVLTTICTNPRAPVPQTQHVIAYNCHGMTVFISPLQDALRLWLIPVFILFGVAAVAMLLRAFVKVRVTVRVEHTRAADGSPDREVPRG